MQTVALAAMPIFRGDEMAEGVGVLVRRHLRVARRAGGEEHQRKVIPCRSVLLADILARIEGIFRIEVVPALFFAADQDEVFDLLAGARSVLRDVGGISVGGADESGNACGVETVNEVVILELIRGGDGDRADLMQSNHAEPELVVAL